MEQTKRILIHDNELQLGNANHTFLLGIISSAPLTVEQAQMGKLG